MHDKYLMKVPMKLKVTCTQIINKDNKNIICGKIAILRCPHVEDSNLSNNYCTTGVCSDCFKKIIINNEKDHFTDLDINLLHKESDENSSDSSLEENLSKNAINNT